MDYLPVRYLPHTWLCKKPHAEPLGNISGCHNEREMSIVVLGYGTILRHNSIEAVRSYCVGCWRVPSLPILYCTWSYIKYLGPSVQGRYQLPVVPRCPGTL